MNRFIAQHITFQKRRVSRSGRRILIIAFPILFLSFFLFLPGWWGHQHFPMPMGFSETVRWSTGLLIASFGLGYYLWTIVLFAKAEGTQVPVAPTQSVVTSGPYAVSRNPMLTAALFMAIGTGMVLDSWSFMLGALVIPTAYILYIRYVEEIELEARFGDEYLAYKKSTPFIFPKLRSSA